jgi:hypothetical protein
MTETTSIKAYVKVRGKDEYIVNPRIAKLVAQGVIEPEPTPEITDQTTEKPRTNLLHMTSPVK